MQGLYHFNGLFQFLYSLVGVSTRCQGLGSVANQTVNTYLIYTGTIQQGSKCMPAVMRGMICGNANSLEGILK